MSIIKGLKNIEAIIDKPKSNVSGEKVSWLKLDDGQSTQIRFISELDADSPTYDENGRLLLELNFQSSEVLHCFINMDQTHHDVSITGNNDGPWSITYHNLDVQRGLQCSVK